MEINKHSEKGFNLFVVKTNKFKTIDISIRIQDEINREDVTKRSLLPFVLKAGTKEYPTKKIIQKELELMYGASFNANVHKTGKTSVIAFSLRISDPKKINNVTLFNEAVDFLHEVVLNPLAEDRFDERILVEEKRLLQDELKAALDNKTKYALQKLVEIMCADERYAINILGYNEDLEAINEKNLYDYYKRVLETNRFDIIINGDINDDMIKYVKEKFSFRKKNSSFDIVDDERRDVIEPRKVVEQQRLNQSKLNIGYRAEVDINSKEYYAMFMFNAILGGYPHSFLFTNVREKNSLCYYVASKYDAMKAIMLIYAGIDAQNYDYAISIIKEQIALIQDGEFTDEIIEQTKNCIVNDLKEALDSQGSISIKTYNDELLNRDFDIKEKIKAINNVKKEEIIACSKRIELDSIYFLKGGN